MHIKSKRAKIPVFVIDWKAIEAYPVPVQLDLISIMKQRLLNYFNIEKHYVEDWAKTEDLIAAYNKLPISEREDRIIAKNILIAFSEHARQQPMSYFVDDHEILETLLMIQNKFYDGGKVR